MKDSNKRLFQMINNHHGLLLLVLFLLFSVNIYAQNNKITGNVKDANGEPLIGASVVSKDGNAQCSGTITDIDGNFAFDAKNGTYIEISSIGYKTQKIKLGHQKKIDVVLDTDNKMLDEIVVVGYGTQKKANLTGAVATIDSKSLNERPVISAANALQGLDPSTTITMGTGSPEANYSINIRGSVSINSGSPLILVDGIEASLKQVNPNDIESISILKDASASAIYGAKASAGVILVTTKSGANQNGKATVTFSSRLGFASNTTSTDFITVGYDHVTLCNRFYHSANGVDIFLYPESNGELQKLLDRRNDKTENPERPWVEVGSDGKYYYYGNYDWFDYLYNNNRAQYEENLSIRGGNDKFNYYVSGRYLNQKGIFKIFGDTYKDYSFMSKFSAKVSNKLRYTSSVNFSNTEMKYPGRPEYEQTIWAMQSQISPAFIPYNPDGTIVQYPNQLYSGSPMGTGMLGAMTANNTCNTKTVRYIILSNQIDYDILKDLKFTASFGYKMRDPMNKYRNNEFDYSRELDKIQTYTAGSVENAYTENVYREREGSLNAYMTYIKSFGKNKEHNLKVVGGFQYTDMRYTTLQVKQTDLSTPSLSSFSVANGEITLQQNINTLRTLGYFGRINYDYKGKYLIELSGRADGSSRFAPNSRWGFFPSISAGWRLSDESWFEKYRNAINNMKIRLSYGSLGNQQVSSYYAYIDQITMDNVMQYTFDKKELAKYASISAPISSDLTWETVTTSNLGLDMSFLNGRLNFTSDFFIRDTKNMLTAAMTLPDVFGASTPKSNSADLRTKGYELSLSWNDKFNLFNKSFNYSITASLGDYTTEITKFYNPDKVISDKYVGMKLGEIWGYKVDGLFKTDEEAAEYQARINDNQVNNRIYSSKGVGENKLRAGDVKFADLNNDGVISSGDGTVDNPGDRCVIGNNRPRYSYSFRYDMSGCNFDFSIFFQGIGKRDWYPASGQSSYDFWGPYAFPMTSFIHEDFEKQCWSEENPNAYFPRQRGYIAYGGGSLAVANDRYLQNVGYLRLKNITIGYTIPLKKIKLDKVRIALIGENLWYWSPLKKHCKTMDPELALTSSTYKNNSGIGYFYSKSISVDLNVTF